MNNQHVQKMHKFFRYYLIVISTLLKKTLKISYMEISIFKAIVQFVLYKSNNEDKLSFYCFLKRTNGVYLYWENNYGTKRN